MIRPDDPQSITLCIRALRSGQITAEYSPPAVALLIEQLAHAQTDTRAELNEMEQIYMTSKTHAALRTEYARGFRDAQRALARAMPDEEPMILSLRPDFVAASEGAAAL